MFLSRLYLSMASLLAAIMLLGDLCAAPSLPSQAFLDQHCVKCHAGEKAKGDFRIAELTLDFSVKKIAASGRKCISKSPRVKCPEDQTATR